MNKRILTLGAAVVVSGTLMITSAFAAMSSTSPGYDAFKTAHKQSHQIDSLTTDAKLSLTDRGQSLVDLQSQFKFNSVNTNGSGFVSINQNGTTHTIDGYFAENQFVFKTSDNETYYVLEHTEESRARDQHFKSHDPAMAGHAESIIDALVGHNKNYFQLEEGPANSSIVKLSMHDDEIPVIINTLGSIMIKAASSEHSTPNDLPNHPLLPQLQPVALPELTEDIQLNGIEFTTVINADQFIEQYDLLIQANGKDAEGVNHELTLNLQLDLSDLNQTTVDVIDLEDKQVEKLDPEHFDKPKHHR